MAAYLIEIRNCASKIMAPVTTKEPSWAANCNSKATKNHDGSCKEIEKNVLLC